MLHDSGSWQHNQRHGSGKLVYANGDVYEGMFANHVRNGTGTFTSKDVTYNGEWANGEYDGQGKLENRGDVYEGRFKKGREYGQGTMTYHRYVSTIRNGLTLSFLYRKTHHPSIQIFIYIYIHIRQNLVYFQTIFDFVFLSPFYFLSHLLFSHDFFFLCSGAWSEYKGEWAGGAFNGKGVLLYRNGDRFEGTLLH